MARTFANLTRFGPQRWISYRGLAPSTIYDYVDYCNAVKVPIRVGVAVAPPTRILEQEEQIGW